MTKKGLIVFYLVLCVTILAYPQSGHGQAGKVNEGDRNKAQSQGEQTDALRYIELIISLFVMLITGSGVLALMWSLKVVKEQISQVEQSMESNLLAQLQNHGVEIQKIFIQDTSFYPYFYENKELKTEEKRNNNDLHHKLQLVSESLGDFFDHIILQKEVVESKKVLEYWKEYMCNIYLKSPVFQTYLKENQNMFSDELTVILYGIEKTEGQKAIDRMEDYKKVSNKNVS